LVFQQFAHGADAAVAEMIVYQRRHLPLAGDCQSSSR
jgi:hypothetical protein